MLRQATLFVLYKIAPLLLFAGLFSERLRVASLVGFAVLMIFLLWRGKDHEGNPVIFGIRRDHSVFGKQRRAEQAEPRD